MYEPYHLHLLYDVVLTSLAFVVVTAMCRVLATNVPSLRSRLFALVIALPIVGEMVAFVAYTLRPAPHTPAGQAILAFHERCGFCRLLDEPVSIGARLNWVFPALLAVAALSLLKSGLGLIALQRLAAVYPPLAIDSYPGLRHRLEAAAARFRVRLPTIVVSPNLVPLALTFGLHRPVIMISWGMLSELTESEVEAVLTHELAHTIRRDNQWNWLATLLRDMLFFLPTTHLAWRQMVASQEEACDDLTVRLTRRPLDLARSLVKAWQHNQPRELVVLSGLLLTSRFLYRVTPLERRVERIVRAHGRGELTYPWNRSLIALATPGLIVLLYALPIIVGC